MKAQVKSTDPGYMPGGDPDPALLAALANDIAPLRPSRPEVFEAAALHNVTDFRRLGTSVGTVPELLLELSGVKAAIRTWHDKQPDEVIREASAYSARLTEIWTELRLLEQGGAREYTQMRTMQVQPVIDEVDRQFKFAQSRITMMRLDVEMVTRGGGGV
jgi:hypothetical protein